MLKTHLLKFEVYIVTQTGITHTYNYIVVPIYILLYFGQWGSNKVSYISVAIIERLVKYLKFICY